MNAMLTVGENGSAPKSFPSTLSDWATSGTFYEFPGALQMTLWCRRKAFGVSTTVSTSLLQQDPRVVHVRPFF